MRLLDTLVRGYLWEKIDSNRCKRLWKKRDEGYWKQLLMQHLQCIFLMPLTLKTMNQWKMKMELFIEVALISLKHRHFIHKEVCLVSNNYSSNNKQSIKPLLTPDTIVHLNNNNNSLHIKLCFVNSIIISLDREQQPDNTLPHPS